MLPIADFRTTNPLESTSIRYANEQTDYIADFLFHPTPTDKSKAKVWQYDTSHYRRRVTKKSSKAAADVLDYTGFYTTFTAELHKHAGEVDPADEREADRPIADIEQDTAMSVTDVLLIDKEAEAVALATTASNYPADLTSTLGAGVTWATDGGDPEADSKTARIGTKARCGKPANALALSWTGFEHLSNNAALKDRLKYTSGQSISAEQLKNLMKVEYLFICKAQYNTNIEGGSTQTLSDIWADDALFFVYDPSPRLKKVCYGLQPIVNRFYSRKYEDQKRGSGDGAIRMIEMGWWYALAAGAVVSSSDGDFTAGYLLKNIY